MLQAKRILALAFLWLAVLTSNNYDLVNAADENAGAHHHTTVARNHNNMAVTELSIAEGIAIASSCSSLSSSVGERIQQGASVLTVENLVSPPELNYLIESSHAAAKEHKKQHNTTTKTNSCTLDGGFQGQSRMPTVAAARREKCTDPLPLEVSQLLELILERLLVFIDQQLPSISTTLFHTNHTASLIRDDKLEYSIREPAINIYQAPGGNFAVHTDNKALTMVVPLSDPQKDFTGGGTAFWPQGVVDAQRVDPSLILKPPAGTAMLFGGSVHHRGMPIQTGTRLVFVASFSRKAVVRYKNGEYTYEYK